MSRSIKHTPYCGDTKTKEAKRRANRHSKSRLLEFDDEVPPSIHRKLSESWHICDYHSIFTLEDWMNCRGKFSDIFRNMSDEEKERSWHKWYKRK